VLWQLVSLVAVVPTIILELVATSVCDMLLVSPIFTLAIFYFRKYPFNTFLFLIATIVAAPPTTRST